MSRRRSRDHRKTVWFKKLVVHLNTVGGYCRMCGAEHRHSGTDEAGLRLAHLAPYVVTRAAASRATCTLACRRCDEAMGEGDWTGKAPNLVEQPDPSWRPSEPPFRWDRDGTMRSTYCTSGTATVTTSLGDRWQRTADGWTRRFA